MARPEPRRPDWLALTPPGASGQATVAPQPGLQRDETVRALVFPATASRPATAAAAGAAPRRPAGAPASLLKSTAPAPPGSALGAEPAYRSALDRLLQRPATAPGTASTARGSGAAGGAVPALPSSRLDSLLTAGRPGSTGQQQQQQHRPPVSGASLDSLLRRPPVATSTSQRAPLPSSRLDELLARPATAAGGSWRSGAPAAAEHGSIAAARPATAAARSSSLRSAAPAAAGYSTAARPAALSPVDEEPSPASRLRHVPSGSAGAGSAGPHSAGSSGSRGQPAGAAAGSHASALLEARPAAAAALGASSAATAVAPSAATAAAAVAALDPGLHDRLRQRIEQAKAQVRQQLSPMFRLSDALLGAGQDPGRAAQALDAATGLAASGFDQLASRPGSRGSDGAGAAGSRPTARQEDGPVAGPAALPPPGSARMQHHERQRHAMQEQREEQQAPGAWSDVGAADLHPAFAAGASSAEEVDSLVANARAAAARAQSAIAGLTSPPRLHAAVASGAAVGTPGGSSATHPAAPLPYAQQRHDQQPVAELQLAAHGGLGGGQLALAAGDAQAIVVLLREESEALIRSECERMVAGMHAVLNSLLDSLQQAQQATQQAQQQQQQPQVTQQAAQLQMEGLQPSGAAQPTGDSAAGSADGSEAGDASATAASFQFAAEHGAEQQAWDLQQLQQPGAGDSEQQLDAGADAGGGSEGELFVFAAAAPQQWEQQQQQQHGQQQQQKQQQQEPEEASPSAGSPPELPNMGGLAGAGFGSPFKLPSHHPSPAKTARGAGQPAPSWAVPQGQQVPGTTAKSLTFAPLPAAATGTPASQATPALLRHAAGGELDAYRTARSVRSVGSPGGSVASSGGGGGSSSRMASSGGGSGGAGGSATPGYYSSWSGGKTPAGSATAGLPTPLLGGAAGGAGGKDMDHILGSIRRLAAEMRVKQGILAAPPSPAAPAVAASATKPPR